LAFSTHRVVTSLACAGSLLLGATLLSGCAPPQYSYVTDSSDLTYFKVPHYWKQLTPAALCTAVEQYYQADSCPSRWTVAYDAGQESSPSDFESLSISEPFVYASVVPNTQTSQTSTPLTNEQLEDSFLPVSSSARTAETKEGFPLTDFKLLAGSTVTISGGFHGVREVFDYTEPNGPTDTFDEVILTNSGSTEIYLLTLHCTTSCYQQNQTAIDAVMSSFTVRSH
jgi:hypothetical protein